MQAYSYHPVTKIFDGAVQCQASPLENDVFLLPASATFLSPPALDVHEAAFFNNGSWEIVPDFRGEKVYSLIDSRITETVSAVGNPVDLTWTLNPPPDGESHYVMLNGVWEEVQKTPEETISEYDRAMEDYLKQVRSQRGYTTREPSDYASSSVTRWRIDASDWIAFRDSVLVYALGVQVAALGGGNLPSVADFISGMPAIAWTNE